MLGPIIWVEGIIASGKTTLAQTLSEKLNLRPYFEPVDSNPFLGKFYEDPKRWAFPMQMFLLAHRYGMQQSASYESIVGEWRGAVLDRGLPGDRVFCQMHYQYGNMSYEEWKIYDYFYNTMSASIRVPSVMVYLDVTPEVAFRRLQSRDRKVESTVSLDYLRHLHAGYLDLLVEIESGRHAWAQGMEIMRVPWNTDHQSTEQIVRDLQSRYKLWATPADIQNPTELPSIDLIPASGLAVAAK